MEILPKTKLFEIFKNFPELEEKVMEIAPPFRNLTNPVLRRTVGKLATVEKAANIGKLDVIKFVNTLRRAVGQPALEIDDETKPVEIPSGVPDWVQGDPIHTVNGTEMLERGEHPLNFVNQTMSEIDKGQFILLQTNFHPIPMIDAMEQQDYKVFHTESGIDHLTFIGK